MVETVPYGEGLPVDEQDIALSVALAQRLEDFDDHARAIVAGQELLCDWSGCIWWEAERTLLVADLHLEKGASLASRGALIPPYDTTATLALLASRIAFWNPATVIALGDSFHNDTVSAYLPPVHVAHLAAMMAGRQWLWLTGNHDPSPPSGIGGDSAIEICIGELTLRHQADPNHGGAELSGHLHPAGRIVRRGKSVRRRCFVTDGTRMILPAFGAYTGGLNIRDRAFDGLFDQQLLHAHLLGDRRVFTISGRLLV